MRTARKARKAGFHVIQADLYQDDVEKGKIHEIDILAYKAAPTEDGSHIQVTFLIECKATEKPFLLFDGGGSINEKGAAISHVMSEDALKFVETWDKEKVAVNRELFPVNKRFSFGVTQALREKKDQDIAWLAMSSVISAAFAKSKKADLIAKRASTGKVIEFIFPVIVTSNRLFSCVLDEKNESSIEEVNSGIVSWRNPTIGQPNVAIDIITEACLDDFLAAKARGSAAFVENLAREINRQQTARRIAAETNSLLPGRGDLRRRIQRS